MSCFLQKARMEVEDLFTDLADWRKLLNVLMVGSISVKKWSLFL